MLMRVEGDRVRIQFSNLGSGLLIEDLMTK